MSRDDYNSFWLSEIYSVYMPDLNYSGSDALFFIEQVDYLLDE